MVERVHTILFVADQATSATFYRLLLACEPILDVQGMTEFALPGGAVLGLMPERGVVRLLGPDADPRLASGASRTELYLVVSDAEEYVERARAGGAVIVSPLGPRDWGHRAAYLRDPDGHLLALADLASASG